MREGRARERPRSAGEASMAETVNALAPWFHNLHLPDGTQTAPDNPYGDFPASKWRRIAPSLPDDLTGWRALDIGCNAGFYSFALAERGAEVVGLDLDPHYLEQARWAAGVYGLEDRVRFERRQVYELSREARDFDLIFFLGVFYHLRYPMLALDIVAELRPKLLVFQSLTTADAAPRADPGDPARLEQRARLDAPGWPKLAFVEGQMLGDPTNWWVPNASGVEAMLRAAGFRLRAWPAHEICVCEPDPDFREDALVRAQRDAVLGRTR